MQVYICSKSRPVLWHLTPSINTLSISNYEDVDKKEI